MKTVYVHPAVMRRILSGNICPITTRTAGLNEGDAVELSDEDEVNSIMTRIERVERRAAGLFRITVADPATAFRPGKEKKHVEEETGKNGCPV